MEDSNKKITLNFKLLTGGTFTVSVESDISVELLKKIVSKKLKINKERICLMNSERELQDGTLKDNGIIDGSKIIVTPNVETGLAQRTENTVMQALESLNDNQVNDFLSGKSPLNLSVRLGDHMMLIQLQLSTLSPSQQNSLKQKVANAAVLKQQAASHSIIECGQNRHVAQPSTSRKRSTDAEDEMNSDKQRVKTDDLHNDDHTKSPIKSLSSMVSSPLTTTVQNMNQNNNKFWAPSVDPIAAKLTSCLCKRLNISCNNNCEHTPESGSGESSSSYSTNHDTHNVIQPVRSIPFHQRPSTSLVMKPTPSQCSTSLASTSTAAPDNTIESGVEQQLLNTDNPALAEASRNLTQTLRKLSKRVFTSKTHLMDSSSSSSSSSGSSSRKATSSSNTQSTSVAGSSGAVIESMKHHGKGIYSGTFSGTLNPALQDKNGRPKRDISTIIHILNDLLSATPQCARNGAKIFFEPTQSSSSPGGKFIKVKKQLSSKTSSCLRCVPSLHSQSQQKCAYGQCNGHLKSDVASTSNTSSSLVPSTSTGLTHYCSGCTQSLSSRKSEIENMKTKSKLDQLKLVMQQKKERREARKANIAPYNAAHGSTVGFGSQVSPTPVTVAVTSPMSSLNGSLIMPGTTANTSTSHLNDSTDASSSSSTTATAIATAISTNNSEIENHLEEVDTVA